MCNLAFLGRNGGKRRYFWGHPLAAAVWTHRAALFKVRDVKNLGKFLVAILTEKNVVRHGRFLLDRSSFHIYSSAPGYRWKPRSLYPSDSATDWANVFKMSWKLGDARIAYGRGDS